MTYAAIKTCEVDGRSTASLAHASIVKSRQILKMKSFDACQFIWSICRTKCTPSDIMDSFDHPSAAHSGRDCREPNEAAAGKNEVTSSKYQKPALPRSHQYAPKTWNMRHPARHQQGRSVDAAVQCRDPVHRGHARSLTHRTGGPRCAGDGCRLQNQDALIILVHLQLL